MPAGKPAKDHASVTLTQEIPIEYARFAILERPICIWDPTIDSRNLRFLKAFDADFFCLRERAWSGQKDEHPLKSAIALRIDFGMALETLFAVLGAVVQAPHCVFGWLSLYRNEELLEIVDRLRKGNSFPGLSPFRHPTFEGIAKAILLPVAATDSLMYERLVDELSKTWRHFAHVFCDPIKSAEYNSLKHGFRVQATPFQMTVRRTDTGDVALHANVEAGIAFMGLKKNPDRRFDFSISNHTLALEPEAYAASLELVAVSVHNAIMYARFRCQEEPDNLKLRLPTDWETFTRARSHKEPVQSFNFGGTTTPDTYFTAEEILSIYAESNEEA